MSTLAPSLKVGVLRTEILGARLNHLAIDLEESIATILDVIDVRNDLVARDEVL